MPLARPKVSLGSPRSWSETFGRSCGMVGRPCHNGGVWTTGPTDGLPGFSTLIRGDLRSVLWHGRETMPQRSSVLWHGRETMPQRTDYAATEKAGLAVKAPLDPPYKNQFGSGFG